MRLFKQHGMNMFKQGGGPSAKVWPLRLQLGRYGPEGFRQPRPLGLWWKAPRSWKATSPLVDSMRDCT